MQEQDQFLTACSLANSIKTSVMPLSQMTESNEWVRKLHFNFLRRVRNEKIRMRFTCVHGVYRGTIISELGSGLVAKSNRITRLEPS